MERYFNTEGRCRPGEHYMVRLDERLEKIKFVTAFIEYLEELVLSKKDLKERIEKESFHDLRSLKDSDGITLDRLFRRLSRLCRMSEKYGRKFFLLYLKPIINGTGNYYMEAQTRDAKRTDVIVDYLGERFIIELKIWHGNEYNERGEQQLSGYLDYFHLNKGYMISFSFNKKKTVGVKKIKVGDRTIVEAVV